MKKITRLLATVALLFGVVGGVKAEKKYLSFKTEDYCAAKWDASTNTLTWGSGGWNSAWTFMAAQGISGDLSSWETLHLNAKNFTNSKEEKLTVVFKKNDGSNPPSGPTKEFVVSPDANGDITIDLTNVVWGDCDITKIQDLTIYGRERTDNNENASVVITDAYLEKPDPVGVNVTYKLYYGETLVGSQEVIEEVNATATVPAALNNPFCTYSYSPTTITEAGDVTVTVTWNGPIAIYSDYASITEWKNLYLNRSKKWYLNNNNGTPCLVGDPSDNDLSGEAYQWALVGNPYSYKIFNKAAGSTKTLNGNSGVTIADGEYSWVKIAKNHDTGMLFGKSDGNYLNQAGGDGNTALGFWSDPVDNGSTFYVATVPVYDALGEYKAALQAAIAKGQMQNAFGKTADSFGALTTAINEAEAELAKTETTADKLTAKTDAITAAIAGLKLQDGYTNLTEDIYKKWDDNISPTTSAAPENYVYKLNESTGQPYGDGSVRYLQFADISDFSTMYILAPAGTPRIMMNRQVPVLKDEPANDTDFKDPNGGDYVQITDAPVEGKVTIDLTAYDYAHLNAIKGANWGNVTVTEILLYRDITVGNAGYATFGSLSKNAAMPEGVEAYGAYYNSSNGKLTPIKVKNNIPAGEGVILMAAAGTYVPTFDVEATAIENNELKVSNGTVVGDGTTIYVLANTEQNGVGFYLLEEGNKVPAGKVYYKSTSNDARQFIGFDEGATAIKTVKGAEAENAIYNLAGQRLTKAQKGLNIVNGKVVLVK